MNPVIELIDVKFKWPQTSNLTINVPELSIFPGEKVFVYGPSGSGKTTLLGLIGGVLLAQSGCVKVIDKNLRELTSTNR